MEEKKATSQAQLRAVRKYNDAHTTQIKFCFNNETDADVLDRLNSLKNKQGYVKALIREDINKRPELPASELKKKED